MVEMYQLEKGVPTVEEVITDILESNLRVPIMQRLTREFIEECCCRHDSEVSKRVRWIRQNREKLKILGGFKSHDCKNVEGFKETKKAMEDHLDKRYKEMKQFIIDQFKEWQIYQFCQRFYSEYDDYRQKQKEERNKMIRRY